ncbi:MAG: selenoneine biosynthesis selenosugar synthase SenB [Candidatus Acidiferrales bacterium]
MLNRDGFGDDMGGVLSAIPMRIQIVTPGRRGTPTGNHITALRWARLLRGLGHRVRVAQSYRGEPADALIALHAYRSAEAVFRFRRQHPQKPIVLALTGTDVYGELAPSRAGHQAMELADRLIILQPLARKKIPPRWRSKARVIFQSVEKGQRRAFRSPRSFDVAVVGHLRRVKDPFRAALAARRLPADSRIRVLHAGGALEPGMAARARAEMRRNRRYRWLGRVSPAAARRLMARSRLLALSSFLEGGANVISEAVVEGVPVLASRIPGSVGLLGQGYPGYFPVGSTRALARLLRRAETDPRFCARLQRWCAKRARRFHPARERAAWKKLLGEWRGN